MRVEFTVYASENGRILWRVKRRILVQIHEICSLWERKSGNKKWTKIVLNSGAEYNVVAPYDEVRDLLLKSDDAFEAAMYGPRLQYLSTPEQPNRVPMPMPGPSYPKPMPVDPSRTVPIDPRPGDTVIICTPAGNKRGTLGEDK